MYHAAAHRDSFQPGLRQKPVVLLVRNALLIRDPVHFPSLASIVGERLLKMGRLGVQICPLISNQDGFAIDRILSDEHTAPIFEFADLRRVEDSRFASRPVEPPLVRFWVVQADDEAFDVCIWSVEYGLFDFRTIPDLPAGTRALVLYPFVRSGQGMQPALQVIPAVADQRVEIVLAIMCCVLTLACRS